MVLSVSTALLSAVHSRDRFEHVLSRSRVGIDARNRRGWRPLHLAAEAGFLDIVQWIVGQGADAEARDGKGWSALMFAAVNDHAGVVELLLSLGKTQSALEAFQIATKYGARLTMEVFVRRGFLLEDAKFPADSVVQVAIRYGQPKALSFLLMCGASDKLKSAEGFTASSIAKRNPVMKEALMEGRRRREMLRTGMEGLCSSNGKAPVSAHIAIQQDGLFALRKRGLMRRTSECSRVLFSSDMMIREEIKGRVVVTSPFSPGVVITITKENSNDVLAVLRFAAANHNESLHVRTIADNIEHNIEHKLPLLLQQRRDLNANVQQLRQIDTRRVRESVQMRLRVLQKYISDCIRHCRVLVEIMKVRIDEADRLCAILTVDGQTLKASAQNQLRERLEVQVDESRVHLSRIESLKLVVADAMLPEPREQRVVVEPNPEPLGAGLDAIELSSSHELAKSHAKLDSKASSMDLSASAPSLEDLSQAASARSLSVLSGSAATDARSLASLPSPEANAGNRERSVSDGLLVPSSQPRASERPRAASDAKPEASQIVLSPVSANVCQSNDWADFDNWSTYSEHNAVVQVPLAVIEHEAEGGTPDSASSSESDDKNLCVVCLDSERSCVFLPCRHLCLCGPCSNHQTWTKCPICNTDVVDLFQVYSP